MGKTKVEAFRGRAQFASHASPTDKRRKRQSWGMGCRLHLTEGFEACAASAFFLQKRI
jgi:hypothetical protein